MTDVNNNGRYCDSYEDRYYSCLGRDTSGVKLMQVDQENVKVSSIELIEESKEEEFAETSEETVGSKEVVNLIML